ncbi:MAG: hypothetical protein J7456_07525 [Chloroflexus sp.]|jgi:photosystem II stability/assembly factor-like uncharacterized protein|nr:hypothetical protein [Chloroflexus sp.]
MRACILYIGTEDGVFVFQFDGRLNLVGRGLENNAVRGIAIHPQDSRIAYIACGLRGWGLYRTQDAGRSFATVGFEDRWVWDVVFHPAPADQKTIYAGTEPPMLYVSHDNGKTFEAFEGIERLPSRPSWKFFHKPFYAGHIHGIALHSERPQRIFAGVEDGALIYTQDGGQTWHETLVGYDLHRVVVDPLDPDRVFAGAGEGLFVSGDGGKSWKPIPELKGKYVHAICVPPQHPEEMYVYVAEKGAPLYRSEDSGHSWRPIGHGLPEARSADSLSVHPQVPEILFYGGDVAPNKSQVFVSFDQGESWKSLSEELPKIWRLRTALAA